MIDIKEIVIATNNIGKLKEIQTILGQKYSLFSLNDLGLNIHFEENGHSFEENALIKAKCVAKHCALPILADDSGLVVPILNNQPGILSARYAGEKATDEESNLKLLDDLSKYPESVAREAEFICCIVLLLSNGEFIQSKGIAHGEILQIPCGNNGFGYDPIFYSYDLCKTFAEASDEEKSKVSHRAKALFLLKNKIENYENLQI